MPKASQIARAKTAAKRLRSGLTGEELSMSSSLSVEKRFAWRWIYGIKDGLIKDLGINISGSEEIESSLTHALGGE